MSNVVMQFLLDKLGKVSGLPVSPEQAKAEGFDKYLMLEHNQTYGGWRLVNVLVRNGAHHGAFGGSGCETRLNSPKMEIKLRALIAGIEFAKGI